MSDKAAFDAFMERIDKEAKAKADTWLAAEKKKQKKKHDAERHRGYHGARGQYTYPGLGGAGGALERSTGPRR